MRHIFSAIILAVSLPAAAADMLGSTLTFMRAYPTPSTPYWLNSTQVATVAAGTGDLIDWYGNSGFHLTVNPEGEAITFELLSSSVNWGFSGAFDGFTIKGFGAALDSASITNNSTSLTIVPTIASEDELRLALIGDNVVGEFTVNVSLVPELNPAFLLAAGLLVVGWMRATAKVGR